MPPVEISLGFMPAFFHKHLGISYGEAYYFDPEHKAAVECAEGRLLYELFGLGSATLAPWPNLFVQPIDLMLHTQGAAWRFPDDATLESIGTPWATLTPDEIAAIDPRETAAHPVIDRLIASYRAMEARYGDRADLLGLKSGTLNIHAPYTTAHQLCGEELFIILLTEPEAARRIFTKIWELYQAIAARLCAVVGVFPSRLYLGDCSASLLSEEVYRSQVLPVNQALARQFPSVGYHSCGSSSHLLPAFAGLPGLESIELGAGTDLASAARLLPGVHLRPLVDPVVMREGTPDDVTALIQAMLRDTASAPAVTLCAWSFDRDTPADNVRALYRATGAGI